MRGQSCHPLLVASRIPEAPGARLALSDASCVALSLLNELPPWLHQIVPGFGHLRPIWIP